MTNGRPDGSFDPSAVYNSLKITRSVGHEECARASVHFYVYICMRVSACLYDEAHCGVLHVVTRNLVKEKHLAASLRVM